jgi:hypothetical protein
MVASLLEVPAMYRKRLFLALMLAGCTAPPAPPPIPLQLQAASAEDELPARLVVAVEEAERHVQALPASWDTAEILLTHPTALTQPVALTLAKGTGLVPSGAKYVTATPFGTLRPKSGYTLTVDLWNGGVGGVLVGEKQQAVNLVGGVNNVVVNMGVLPPLALTSANPTHGVPGDAVTLTGKGFSVLQAKETLSLGGQGTTITAATNTTLDTALPPLAPGSYTWTVSLGSATASLAGFLIDGVLGAAMPWVATNNKAIQPALAYGGGQYMLAWSRSSGGGNADIYVQRIQPSGLEVGTATKVDAAIGKHGNATIVYSPSVDKFLVAWLDLTGQPTLRTQLINPDASLFGAQLSITTSATPSEYPALCFDSVHDQFGVIWSDNRSGTAQIYGMGLSTANAPTTGAGTINASTNAQRAPALAFSPRGTDYAVAWEETVGGVQKVRAQIEYGTGFLVQPAFFVDATAGATQTRPAWGYDPVSGDFLLAWADSSGNPGIRAQRVKFSGTAAGAVIPLEATAGANAVPRLAYEPWQGKFVVNWQDNRAGGTTWDVYGQYMGIDGVPWGSNFPVATNVGAGSTSDVAADPVTPHGLVAFEINNKILGQLLR